jgi:hypothetical protein
MANIGVADVANGYRFKDFGCVNEQVELGDFMAFPSPA